ncbi:replication/maintenance protein RepL [Butyrivibrio sp. YAB3001]|uniref:replication/maintenance protein RepL n=1 Tax=Butyrivibrio sp. YAB3001 TaxID=1520812 RepID=UPI0008F67B59|nr:replication/maintenance protein RepL [Butyrivibrio sp. YAB3001]SFC42106.1 replication protein (RepL) [Butyrivibrio sp. YAB3001]
MIRENSKTRKKMKTVGMQEYVNADTGELKQFKVESVEERDFNFYKVWMPAFITSLCAVSNQKAKVMCWIIDNINKENQLIYTQRVIASKTNSSLETVNSTIKELLKKDFMRKVGKCYMVNPNILFKGTMNVNARLRAVDEYLGAKRG